jgi:peptidyl-prolyl cis-trans isomerase B (cyclophilin B)
MKKFHVMLFLIILIAFGGILYVSQRSVSKSLFGNQVPQLPQQSSINIFATPKVLGQVQQSGGQQQQPTTQPTTVIQGPLAASVSATIETSKGNITLTLYGDVAPNTVANFINKANSGYYKGLIFHRVEDWVIQGGDPMGNGTGGGEIATEINQRPFVQGSIGMARGNNIQISNDSQFFITKTDASWLNGQYDNFGIVTNGMDVVNAIQIGDKILGITINNQ